MEGLRDIEDTGMSRDEREAFASDVIGGLSGAPKTLPCKWLYDLRGSELFEEITELEEYYPTRTEIGLLDAISDEIGDALPQRAWVVEFGSGSSRKSDLFLNGLNEPKGYIPIDVSADFLEAAADALADRLPHLKVRPIVGDFTGEIPLPDDMHGEEKVGFFRARPSAISSRRKPPGSLSGRERCSATKATWSSAWILRRTSKFCSTPTTTQPA